MSGPARAFIAASLDGFIAGPGDDLSWLPQAPPGEDFGYGAFMDGIAVLLLGRSTYRVVEGFEGAWPYGDRPVLVATHRPLVAAAPTVEAVAGTPQELLERARALAAGGGIYVDGGELIRQLLDAGLLDELTISVIPVVLGTGTPLLAGAARRHALELVRATTLDLGIVQLTYRPVGRAQAVS